MNGFVTSFISIESNRFLHLGHVRRPTNRVMGSSFVPQVNGMFTSQFRVV